MGGVTDSIQGQITARWLGHRPGLALRGMPRGSFKLHAHANEGVTSLVLFSLKEGCAHPSALSNNDRAGLVGFTYIHVLDEKK